MRDPRPLTIAGIITLLVGGWSVSVAGAPAYVFLTGACVLLLATGLALTGLCWRSLVRAGEEVMFSLLVACLGTIPGLTLLMGALERQGAAPEILPGFFWVPLLWYLTGPMMFGVSAVVSPPKESPRALNIVRCVYLAAWAAPTWFTISSAIAL